MKSNQTKPINYFIIWSGRTASFSVSCYFRKNLWGCLHGVKVKAIDYGIVVSEFVFQSRYYVHFGKIPLGNYNLSSQLWVKLYHYCSSRRMALALNNLKRVDMPLNKETTTKKQNPYIL